MPTTISGSSISTANLNLGGTFVNDTFDTFASNNYISSSFTSNNYISSSFTSNNYLTNIFASNNYVTANLGGGGSSANVISVFDTVSGCPPSRAAGTSIMRIDFTLAEGAFFKVHYQIIATHTARIDHYLVIDGTTQGMALTDTNNAGWKPVNLFYGGYLPAGSHYTYITASVASKTGCGSMWGRGYLTIYE